MPLNFDIDFDSSETRMTLRRLRRRPKYRYMTANRIVPHLPWLVLLILSGYLYKARIFDESGYYLMQLINHRFYYIHAANVVQAIWQTSPLIGVWLNLPIKYILIVYSLGFTAFTYLLFLISYYGLRDRRSGILILLSQTAIVAHSFFVPTHPLFLTVPLLFTFYAFHSLPYHGRSAMAFMLVIEAFMLLSHPMAYPLFIYLMVFDFITRKPRSLREYAPFITVMIACIAITLLVDYKSFTELVQNKLINGFSPVKSIEENRMHQHGYFYYLFRYQYEAMAFLLITLVFLILKKDWKPLIILVLAVASYLIVVRFDGSKAERFILEMWAYPLLPLIGIPFIYGYPKLERTGIQNISVLLLSAFITYRVVHLAFIGENHERRAVQIAQLTLAAQQKNGSKFIVDTDLANRTFTQFNWSLPNESLLLSAINGNDITVTLATDKDFKALSKQTKVSSPQFLWNRWEIKNDKWLNSNYFHLDMGPYKMLNDTAPNKDMDKRAEGFHIEWNPLKFYRAGDTIWMKVNIINKSETPIYTGTNNKIALSYLWIKDYNVLYWNEVRTPLQADVKQNMQQYLRLAVPRTRGKYFLNIDIISNDQWLGINNKKEIMVY